MLRELLGINLSAKQIQGVREHYGEGPEQQTTEQVSGKEVAVQAGCKEVLPSL